MSFIQENPWTVGLALLGALISAIILPSPMQDFISSFNFDNVTQNPTETLTGWVIGFPIAMIGETFIKIISGLIGGLVGAVIGIFIDGRRNNGGLL